jgi:two-component system, response regulator, stage 0 sporulation protein F
MSKKVLVVDDDNMMHMLYQAHFREEMSNGKAIFFFKSSGPDAIEFLKTNTVDIVLSDVNMPRMSGLELLKILKDEYPELDVCIISSFNDHQTEAESLNAKCFLQKPVKMDDLKEMIFN